MRPSAQFAADLQPEDESPMRSVSPAADSIRGADAAAWFIAAALIATTLCAYGQVWHFGFTGFDDASVVVDNPFVRSGLAWRNIVWAFTSFHGEFWIPLTRISLMIDAQMYGTWAGGFHLTNVALHIANALLLFALFRSTTGAVGRSGIVALLFAIHPLHVESVAWITERKDVLSTFFGLLAIAAYVGYARSHSGGWYAACLAAFVASLMSKTMLVTLPFLLLLLDLWPLGRWQRAIGESGEQKAESGNEPGSGLSAVGCPDLRVTAGRLIGEKAPLLAVTVLFAAITIHAQSSGGSVQGLEKYPLPVRLSNAAVSYVLYLRKGFWPSDLGAYYPHPGGSLPAWQVAGAAILLASISAIAVFQIRRRPFLFVGWFWYLGLLVPVIGIVQIWDFRMADRYSYLPLVGATVAVVWLVPRLPRRLAAHAGLASAAVLVSVSMTALAQVQVGHWRGNRALFERALAVTQNNAIAHDGLGTALARREQHDGAIAQYRKALAINPRMATFHNHLAVALGNQGEIEESIRHSVEAIRLDRGFAEAWGNLGVSQMRAGNLVEAVAAFEQASRLRPNDPLTKFNLAKALFDSGDYEQALIHAHYALMLDPRFEPAQQLLLQIESARRLKSMPRVGR